jgi:Glycosyl transferase family 2
MKSLDAIPRVSIVVNTYNHERFLAQALRSVIRQDFPAHSTEIIVVDDGSTDSTYEVLGEFLPYIRYIHQKNGGQVSAFNTGLAEARGEILAFLDGDDWWEATKLSRIVAAFDANPKIAAVGHGYYEVNEDGAIAATISPEKHRYLSLESPAQARESAPFRIFLGTSRLAIRRSVAHRALPVPPALPFFDNFIFTQAIAISGAEILPQPLCHYRIHSGSLYTGEDANQNRLRMRYKLLCGLLEHLPLRLSRMGIPEDTIAALLEFDFVDRDRLKLILEGGTPFETFRVERTAYQISCSNPSVGYRCFKGFTFLAALLLPPKTFYQVHQWYAKHDLMRARQWIGNATPSTPHVSPRRAEAREDSRRG